MPPRPSRLAAIVVCMTAMVTVLSGCVQIQVESEFEEDGSAVHAFSMSIERTFLEGDMLGDEFDGELDFEEIEQQAEEAGLESERIDTPERLGIRLSTEVEDNEDLGEVLGNLFDSAGGTGGGSPVDGFEGGFTSSDSFGGSEYRLELTVDAGTLFDESQEELDSDLEGDLDSGLDPSMMRQFIDFTYTATLPGELTDHNGQELGSSAVQWELPVEGTETFIAESEGGSSFPIALVIGIGIGVIALVLVVVGGMTLMRGQKTPQSADAARDPASTSARTNEHSGYSSESGSSSDTE